MKVLHLPENEVSRTSVREENISNVTSLRGRATGAVYRGVKLQRSISLVKPSERKKKKKKKRTIARTKTLKFCSHVQVETLTTFLVLV